MNSPGKTDYPHLALHLVTVLVALAALALGLFNYREIRKDRVCRQINTQTPTATPSAPHNKTADGTSVLTKEKKTVAVSRHKKRPVERTMTAETPAVKDLPQAPAPGPGIRDRGLDEIITDLVNSVLD